MIEKQTSGMARHSRASSMLLTSFAAIAICTFGTALISLPAAETNTMPERIGVYDSRAIAYAHFWSDTYQRGLNERMRAARAAKASGQTNRFAELSVALKNEQDRVHLQVFSTAPIDDVLATMREPIARIQTEEKVSRFVSKWDEKTLQQYPRGERIDLTDRLLKEFTLTEKQKKAVAELRNKPPLALDRAEKLLREGKL